MTETPTPGASHRRRRLLAGLAVPLLAAAPDLRAQGAGRDGQKREGAEHAVHRPTSKEKIWMFWRAPAASYE